MAIVMQRLGRETSVTRNSALVHPLARPHHNTSLRSFIDSNSFINILNETEYILRRFSVTLGSPNLERVPLRTVREQRNSRIALG